jgi:hypothetical protein
MKMLLYPFYAIASWVITLIAYLFAPIICLFVKTDGTLYLSWFGTPDAPAMGAEFWKEQHPTYSDYKLAVTWMWRNPAQGFDQLLKADVTMKTPYKVWWRNGDNYFYTANGYFHWSYRIGLATGGLGWRLNNIVEGYDHPTMGQLVTTIIRFHK